MKILLLKTFRIAPKIPLETVIRYFRLDLPGSWKEYIILNGRDLNEVFKCRTDSKKVFLFDFGCAVFLNFNSEEISTFLEFLQSLTGNVDYSLLAKYHERHIAKIYPDNTISLWRNSSLRFKYNDGIITLIAAVLAKSTALEKIERDLDNMLDEAEGYISKLQKGRLKANTGSFAATAAHLLRYEFDISASIRIFDRPYCTNCDFMYRNIYDKFSKYYELSDRLEVLERKTGELRNIVKSYSNISYSRQERRLILFEVFLLALFPLSYLAGAILQAPGINHILNLLFGL